MMPCYLVYTRQAPAGRAVKCCTAKVCGVQGLGLIFGVRPFVVNLQILVGHGQTVILCTVQLKPL